MSEYFAAHIIVTGIVQGVGFRWFVVQNAKNLGVNGWARNKPDGSVEIVAEGTRGAIEALIKEIRTGPRFSSVRGVNVEWQEYTGAYNNFDVRF